MQKTYDSEALSRLVQKDATTPVRMKALIDSLYEKEKRFIYQKQGSTRADFVGNQSVIFNLVKVHDLPINHFRNNEQSLSDSSSFGVVKGTRVQMELHKQ